MYYVHIEKFAHRFIQYSVLIHSAQVLQPSFSRDVMYRLSSISGEGVYAYLLNVIQCILYAYAVH